MIRTLPVTILIEGIVILIFSALCQKPAGRLLPAGCLVNVLTQAALSMALVIFFRYYLITLAAAEALIWIVESLLMHRLSGGLLTRTQAVLISLCMNLASFGAGLGLPF